METFFADSSHPSPSTSPLVVQLFGAVRVWVRGEPLPRLRSRKGLWLIALLALRPGRELQRAWLMELLWPESEPELAAHSLRTTLTDLRRALGPEAARLASPTSRTLRLEVSGAEVDVLRFDRAIARGSLVALQEAVSVYGGPLLEDCAEEWAIQERLPREQAFLAAMEKLAQAALEKGDLATAEQHLRRAIATDPLRESACRSLMRALAAGGNPGAALATYGDLQERLRRKLNTRPDAETQALFESLQADARSKTRRDALRRPEGLARELSARAIPLASLTSFVGREKEIDALVGLLAEGHRPRAARLVTLTGAGGCGKSRLALEAVQRLPGRLSGGVWLVELASMADPERVPAAVAAALGEPEEPGHSLVETLIRACWSRQLLLLLDNCEHLIPACAALCEALLPACPGLRVLVTSREPLGVPGEQCFAVPPLKLPAALDADGVDLSPFLPSPGAGLKHLWKGLQAASGSHELARIAKSEAVQLFLDRAAGALPGFRLTSENARAVVRVCRQLDGIPLAIELAAARSPLLSVDEMAARLEDRFALLTRGGRVVRSRHQTLRAAVEWSYDLLSAPERTLFRRLSVFSGGFTLAAAEAVCGSDVLDLLTGLVEKSLVTVEERDGRVRHRMLETFRAYAIRRSDPEERSAGAERHARYFLTVAEAADPRKGACDSLASLTSLEEEHDNLRAALHWSFGPAGEPAMGMRIAVSVGWFWAVRMHFREGRAWLEQALARCDGPLPIPPGLRARVMEQLGQMLLQFHRSDGSTEMLRASLAVARSLNDRRLMAWALNGLGRDRLLASRWQEARLHLDESLALFREINDPLGLTWSLSYLGLAESRPDGEAERARLLLEQSLARGEEIGELPARIQSLDLLARLAQRRGDYRLARGYLEQRLHLAQAMKARGAVADALTRLGEVLCEEGDDAAAAASLTQALELHQQMGKLWDAGATCSWLGLVRYSQGQIEEAQTLQERALAIWREFKFEGGLVFSLSFLGEIARRREDAGLATRALREAWTIWQGWEERWRIDARNALGPGRRYATLLFHLGLGAAAAGDTTAARALVEESLALQEAMGHDRGIQECREALALLPAASTLPD